MAPNGLNFLLRKTISAAAATLPTDPLCMPTLTAHTCGHAQVTLSACHEKLGAHKHHNDRAKVSGTQAASPCVKCRFTELNALHEELGRSDNAEHARKSKVDGKWEFVTEGAELQCDDIGKQLAVARVERDRALATGIMMVQMTEKVLKKVVWKHE